MAEVRNVEVKITGLEELKALVAELRDLREEIDKAAKEFGGRVNGAATVGSRRGER